MLLKTKDNGMIIKMNVTIKQDKKKITKQKQASNYTEKPRNRMEQGLTLLLCASAAAPVGLAAESPYAVAIWGAARSLKTFRTTQELP